MKTKEVEQEVKEFYLPTEEVTVKFVPRKKGMAANVDTNHVISGGMLTNAVKKYMCPLQRTGGIANILSKEEKAYLEQELGINLSVYGDFWSSFQVTLRKDNAANRFNLNNPIDFISVRILEQYTDEIAHTWKLRHSKPTYMFAITRAGEEINESKVKLDVKKIAFKLYGKIEDDKEKLKGVLRLLSNQPISPNSKLDWLQGKVQEYVDTDSKTFVSVLEDQHFETKLLINNAVEAGIIKKNGSKYKTIDGLDLCNNGDQPTFTNAVRYLDEDKNQEVRLLIEARLEKTKE